MGIFAELDVAAAFNGVAPLLTENGAKQLSGRLRSRTTKDALAAEWEVIMMNALRDCGTVEIEPLLRSNCGKSRPDVLLHPHGNGVLAQLPPCYIEISAVSDDGYEAENPRQLFIETFKRLLKRRQLRPENFRVEIRGAVRDKTAQKRSAEAAIAAAPKGPTDWNEWFRGSTCNDKKMRLALPPKSKIEQFVQGRIGQELEAISTEPSRPHKIKITDDGVWSIFSTTQSQQVFLTASPLTRPLTRSHIILLRTDSTQRLIKWRMVQDFVE